MSVAAQRFDRRALRVRPDDHWLGTGPTGERARALMTAVVVISFAAHAGLIAAAFLADRPITRAPEKEIAVEIVHDVPAAKPVAEVKPAPAAQPKAETTPTANAARAEPARSKISEAEKSVAKVTPPPARAKAPTTQAAAKTGQRTETLAALQRELAGLRAEQAALRKASDNDPTPEAVIGPHSFQAIALPSTSETGELVGYERLVFSQLFKAKEAHVHEGLPGTATVLFKVDDAGHLIEASVLRPSGIAALDAEALQVIHEAAPFPLPPKGSQREFSANVSFVVGSHP